MILAYILVMQYQHIVFSAFTSTAFLFVALVFSLGKLA